MKRFSVLAITILLAFLCACTKQPKTDIFEFSDRLNSQLAENIIEPSDYYNSGNDYYYFPSSCFMLTLTTDEARIVRRCEITLTQPEHPDEEYSFKVFSAMCGVLCNKTSDEITELFSKNSFDASKIVFSESTISFSSDNADFFIYTNSEIISLMCEVKS